MAMDFETRQRLLGPSIAYEGGLERWGWILAAGIVSCFLGLLAIASAGLATLATIILIGALLLVGGVVHLFQAFPAGRWQAFMMHLMLGALYIVAGLMFLYAPIGAAISVTLLLAILLFFSGATRLVVGLIDRVSGWGWMVGSGIASMVLGALVFVSWPLAAWWMLGIFVGLELIFGGTALIGMALSLRKALRSLEEAPETTRGMLERRQARPANGRTERRAEPPPPPPSGA